jgi:hypothetical protein
MSIYCFGNFPLSKRERGILLKKHYTEYDFLLFFSLLTAKHNLQRRRIKTGKLMTFSLEETIFTLG